jgi:hypothetical protein
MLFVAQPAFAVPSAMQQMEPAMQLAWQLSAPVASEDERDLLRREYRLIQGASEFWVGFDNLNARITEADLLRNLHGLSMAPRPRPAPLLPGLGCKRTAPMASLPLRRECNLPGEEGSMAGVGCAVLGADFS